MRTLGPRSVSSFLKVFLDIVFVFLTVWTIFLGILALGSAAGMAFTNLNLPDWRWPWGLPLFVHTPRGASGLLLFALFSVGLLAIVGRLRKIFVTLIKGEPFQSENARRLRVIGLILAALEISRYAIWAVLTIGASPETMRAFRPDVDFVGIFAIGVMFVLAEIFDEGARMRKDLDLTI